jgi:DNA processing protein
MTQLQKNRVAYISLVLQSYGGGTLKDFLELEGTAGTLMSLRSQFEFLLNKEISESDFFLRLHSASENLAWLAKNSAHHIWPGHCDYPICLYDLERPPVSLTYWGQLPEKFEMTVSVVGSREAHPLSKEWMNLHLAPLAKKGFCIVSGGARGIDQLAHYIAISNGSPTVAFLPSGLAEVYPTQLRSLIPEIIRNKGAVVSELLPFDQVKKYYFHQRNRLIVGLSSTLLLVEARRKSGSVMTARLAIENHRNLAVVPGSPIIKNWEGSCDLLTTGAFPIRDLLDLETLLAVPTSHQDVNSNGQFQFRFKK